MLAMEAAEEESSISQETDCMLEKVPAPRAGNEIRWTKMKTCDRERKKEEIGKKKQEKNSQGKVPRTFPWLTDRVRTQEPLKRTARRRTHAPEKVEAIKWKGVEFKKNGRKRSGRRGRKRKRRR